MDKNIKYIISSSSSPLPPLIIDVLLLLYCHTSPGMIDIPRASCVHHEFQYNIRYVRGGVGIIIYYV